MPSEAAGDGNGGETAAGAGGGGIAAPPCSALGLHPLAHSLHRLHCQSAAGSGTGSHGYNCHNMSTLEADLKKQILGRSKAEKVFRPWWDTLEDYLLNCLVLLGESVQNRSHILV